MKIAVISGKGGSGKSSITAAFIALAEQVVAIDCDVDASNLPLLFPHEVKREEKFSSGQQLHTDADSCIGCGLCAEKCTFQAIHISDEGKAVANDLLCEGCGLCVRICPKEALSLTDEANSSIYTSSFEHGCLIHGDLNPGDDNSGKMIARLREIADKEQTNQNISLQILDGPPGIGCPVLSTVTGVNKVIIVCEPSLSGINDLKRAYKVASSFCKKISVIINKCTINEENRTAIRNLCNQNNIPVIAELPFDRSLVKAQLHCESIVTYAPESVCSKELHKAFERITAE